MKSAISMEDARGVGGPVQNAPVPDAVAVDVGPEGVRSSVLQIGAPLMGLGVAGAISWLLTAATMTWLARKLGVDDFGLINLGLAIASCAAAFAAPNLNVWGARAIATEGATVEQVILTVKAPQLLLGGVIAVLVSAGAWLFYDPRFALGIAVCTTTIVGAAANLQWVAQGKRRLGLVALNQLVSSLFAFLFVVALVRSPANYWIGPAALAAGQILAALALLAIFIGKGWVRLRIGKIAGLPRSLAPGGTYWITSVTAVVIQYAGFIAVSITGSGALGFYSAAGRLYLTLMLMSALVTTVFFPLLSKQFSDRTHGTVLMLWIVAAGLIGALPGAVLAGAPGYFIDVVLKASYVGADFYIQMAGLGFFFNAIATAYVMAVLAAGDDRTFLITSLATAGAALLMCVATVLIDVRAAGVGLATIDLVYFACVLTAFRRTFGRLHLEVLACAAVIFALTATLAFVLHASLVSPWLGLPAIGVGYLLTAAACGLWLLRSQRKAA